MVQYIHLMNIMLMYRFTKVILTILIIFALFQFPAWFSVQNPGGFEMGGFIDYTYEFGFMHISPLLYLIGLLYSNHGIDSELVDNIKVKSKLLAVIENLDQSLIIIEDSKISFINSQFFDLFQQQI